MVEDGKILGEFYIHTKLTHSQTLMPMIQSVLNVTNTKEPEMVAVTAGPGSFTGVRIGIASAKGLCMPGNIPCVGISALEALAYNYVDTMEEKYICAMMDARCGQAYYALFHLKGGRLTRLTGDSTAPVTEILESVKPYANKLLLLGDGAKLYYEAFQVLGAMLAPENLRYQRASAVAFAAIGKKFGTCAELQPIYLQLPQAQRELNKRMNEGK